MGKIEIDERVTQYIDGVLSGDVVVGRTVRLAIERHVSDLRTAERRGLVFDAVAANFAIDFIECMPHSKGEWAGDPIKLEPWQAWIVASVFGWKQADGRRRFNSVFICVARKNGKSTLLAPIGLLLAFADGEEGAEVYTFADQAGPSVHRL